MTENLTDTQATTPGRQSRWRVLGWVLLGGVIGAALVMAFVAYGQPGLLLEQMNLRYCG
jgi:hypothetical protein